MATIPDEFLERTPLMQEGDFAYVRGLLQHPDAPVWNYQVGDRITARDVERTDVFRQALGQERKAWTGKPPEWWLDRLEALRLSTPVFADRLPQRVVSPEDYGDIEPVTREVLALSPELLVPLDADLDSLIVYDSSGTTGHSMVVPHHPADNAATCAMIEFALARHGATPDFRPGAMGCININIQARTVVFATVLSIWNRSGLAKVNLNPSAWPEAASRARFLTDTAPEIVTGEPRAFAELLAMEGELGSNFAPKGLLSTATILPPALKRKLEERFRCPAIDWYSVTEAGPIAYSCPQGHLHILPHDMYVEIADADGRPVPPGTRGRILLSGGRNPYLPLLRYDTGDQAVLDPGPCPCGDPQPMLKDFDGRQDVPLRAANGETVNSVDVSRVIRNHPVLQHRLVQRRDGALELTAQSMYGSVDEAMLERDLRDLFGAEAKLSITVTDQDLTPEGEKLAPYVSELEGHG